MADKFLRVILALALFVLPAKSSFMKSPDGITVSSWYDGLEIPKFGPAQKSATADVCVIGAGISGLNSAYLLLKEGKSVIVLDEGEIGGGQTGRTSAHLSSYLDDQFTEIEKHHGVEGSKLAYQSHAAAIDTIERIVTKEKIDCDFKRLDAFLSPVPSDSADFLDRELKATQAAGFADVEKIAKGGIDHGPCLRLGNQAKFQPMAYLVGLTQAIKRLGGIIHTGKRVSDVQGTDAKNGTPAIAKIVGGVEISADAIVVATNTPSPINNWMGIYTKQASYRTYMLGMTIPRGSVPDALYWDSGDPYHYVRVQEVHGSEHDLLLIGGEDHKTGQFPSNGSPFLNLETWTRRKFPKVDQVEYRWSGQVQEPDDGLGFIGHAPTQENVYVITGDSGMGLTHGTLGAMLITDQIMGRKNPWETLYDPNRKELNKSFISENLNVAIQYKDLLTPGEVKSVDEISAGDGAVMRDGLSKLAVYRDDDGKLHKHSAVCTHLQCIVQWNPIEKSWDCPCHGSRFDPCGKVLMGPAIDNIPAAK